MSAWPPFHQLGRGACFESRAGRAAWPQPDGKRATRRREPTRAGSPHVGIWPNS